MSGAATCDRCGLVMLAKFWPGHPTRCPARPEVEPDYDTRRPRDGLTAAQADGTACVICGKQSPVVVPAGWVTDNPSCESQVFRCSRDCSTAAVAVRLDGEK